MVVCLCGVLWLGCVCMLVMGVMVEAEATIVAVSEWEVDVYICAGSWPLHAFILCQLRQ